MCSSDLLPDIIEDMTTPNADIVRVRIASDGGSDGSLPLEEGTGAFLEIRELMLSAACSAIEPRGVYSKRKPDRAMKYLREARIGQTRRGSYVITVLSPVPPILRSENQQLLLQDMDDEPFSRKTVRTLAEALSATAAGVASAVSSGKMDGFSSGIAKGVSANLCDALVGLNKGGGSRGLDFGFSWAPSRGAPPDVKGECRLPTDAMPYLEEASRHFRQTSEVEGAEVFGIVHKLEHVSETDGGKVTIVATVDGTRRTIVTELQGDMHKLAIRAYEDYLPVACVGELVKEGKSHWLRNPRDFRVVDEAS